MQRVIKIDEARFNDIKRIAEVQLKSNYFQSTEQLIAKSVLIEQEPCEDCISRQAVIDALEKVAALFPWRVPGKLDTYDSYNGTWNDAIGRAEMEIEGLPPVNPQRTGHWIFDEILDKHYYCSECKSMGVNYWDFCPYCGAKMVEPQESEE